MIDERINQTLSELESNLKNIESARKQVEKTANSYEGLKSTTAEYVTELGNVTTKTKKFIDAIRDDYIERIKLLEKDRENICNAATAAIENLSNATDSFRNSLNSVHTKLKFCLIVNLVSLIAIVILLIMLLK